jgi:hypothetical protein
MTPMQYHCVAATPKTGFGFEEIMRDPDYTRFMNWYARSSFFAAGRRASTATAAARPALVKADAAVDLAAAA